jgi:hypothetical protein
MIWIAGRSGGAVGPIEEDWLLSLDATPAEERMESDAYPRMTASRRTGGERFRCGPEPLPFDLLSFWQWSASDLASNVLRGRLAEYLVAQALGVADRVRAEWDAYDLRSLGGTKIEVKSAAYLQSWAQKAPSAISFDIAPTRFWDAASNMMAAEPCRQADLYVFALLAHEDKATLDPLDVGQWRFFVLPTAVLNARCPSQKRLGLAGLLSLCPIECPFGQLREAIESAA